MPMERSWENRRPVVGKPVPSTRDMESRRPLGDIINIVRDPRYPRAIATKPVLEKSGRDEQKQLLVSFRPVTRKFAASPASKEQPDHQATAADAVTPGADHQNESILDGTIDDDDDWIDDLHTDEMKGNDIVTDDGMMDIDRADRGNPLAATEYVEELYTFYRENEETSCVNPDYMFTQEDINERMRAILIDWLIEIHYKFELMDQTLFLTVNTIDRFLEKQVVPRKKLQLVGMTAMLLACKYEEVLVPVIEDLVMISDRAYTREQILQMEKMILNALQYNMAVPTPYVFLRRFLKAADSDKQLELVSFFMLELCLVEYQMLKYRPSLLAAAAVYTAKCAVDRCQNWTKICAVHSRYTRDQLIECSKKMVKFHLKAGDGKLTGAHRKYSTLKFGYAAKVLPAVFLLEESGGSNKLQLQSRRIIPA